jgi:hypothetical protein
MSNQSVLDSDSFNDFLTGYRECAVWCGIMVFDELTGDDLYSTADLSDDAVIESQKDCQAFFESNLALMQETGQKDFGTHGFDFYLSRNGHGAGYFDRGYGAVGDELQSAARVYGSANLFVGNDEKLHFMG